MIGKILGRYKIKSLIGEGGMATVYLAEDTTLHREVAVKMIRVGEIPPNQLPRILARFKREAESLARLSDDPAIVTVHDYGEYEDAPYLVMAYMPGGTLKDRLGSPMDYREAVELLLPVAEALALAHEHGIVHRDVKPSNLLVDRKGNLALADFGIAKALEVDGQTLTGTGMGVGTPEYMAPEQWKGEASPQTDIYALGVVLYEMVTGKKPYSAGTPSEVFLKQMTQPPERPRNLVPGLPGTVEALLDKAMDKEPEVRFVSMMEFQAVLQGVLTVRPVYDESPIAVAQLAVQKPDLDATVDELVLPLQKAELTKEREPKEPEPAVVSTAKPKHLWMMGVGVVSVLVLVWGIAIGLKGEGPMRGLATVTQTPIPTPTLRPTLGVGSTKISKKDGMEMVYVPEGTFTMGSNDGDGDEQPVHEVYLDAFWIDKYEVTNVQYAECVADGDCNKPSNTIYYEDRSYADHPVVYVSWYDATDYCEWAGRQLPSEAEWEKAARGPGGLTYPWGQEEPNDNLLNFDNSQGHTTPGGVYPDGISHYGALDMAGNVWEWTSSLYDTDDGREDLNASGTRVLRGGSWGSNGEGVRSAGRIRLNPVSAGFDFGFRCAGSP